MSSKENVTMTREDALSYLWNNLLITAPEEKLRADREALLNEIILAMQRCIPFHTVKSICTPHEDRHLPTLPEIMEDMYSGLGGRCYTINNFLLILLRSLGFDTFCIPSDWGYWGGYENAHILLIVRNLTAEGTSHMVDVGAGCPSFRAISLDFAGSTSPVYQDSFLRYRFVREGDSILRQHIETTKSGDFESRSDEWVNYIIIHHKKLVNMSFFKDTMTPLYTTPMPNAPMLNCPRCQAFPDNRYVRIKDTTLLAEDEEGRVQKSYLRSRDEIRLAFQKYFPQIPLNMVTTAMNDRNVSFDFNKGL